MNYTPLIIYQTSDGKVKIETHFENEMVWLTQKQIATLFAKGRSTITEHIGNVFKEGGWIKHAGEIYHKMALEKSGKEYKIFKCQQKVFEAGQSLQEIEADIRRLDGQNANA